MNAPGHWGRVFTLIHSFGGCRDDRTSTAHDPRHESRRFYRRYTASLPQRRPATCQALHALADELSEKQVEDYIFYLREEKKVAKGTFQEYFHAIRFLYVNTLNYDWALFTKKSSPAASETTAPRPQQRRLPRADRRSASSRLSCLPGHDVRLRAADE